MLERPPTTEPLPEVLTLAEAAAFLRVDPADLERKAENGVVPAMRFDSGFRFL
jgi:hypothetical protein